MALSGEAEDDEFVGESEDVPLPQVARLDTIAAVVDAARLVTEFCGGNSLLKKDIEEHDIEALLVQQIEFCNVILINKTDLVTLEELEQVKKVVTALQPHAKIIETQRGQVDLSDVLGTNSFDFESVFETAHSWNSMRKNTTTTMNMKTTLTATMNTGTAVAVIITKKVIVTQMNSVSAHLCITGGNRLTG